MSIEQEIFKKVKVNFQRLIDYVFQKKESFYYYSCDFLDQFQARIRVDEKGILKGKVYDLLLDDEYFNFRVETQTGEFVGKVKEEYQKILEDIKEKCFTSLDFTTEQANRISALIYDTYQDRPYFAWEDENGVFRNPDNLKWYGLIMNIDRSKLNRKQSGKIDVLNVKLDKDKIIKLLDKKGFYKAYHMNKTYWITIVLDDTLKDLEIMECIKESHAYTETTEEWIVPANPKFYDIIDHFKKSDVVTWKQSTNIKEHDIIYLYVGSPYSSIMYQCEAIKVNIAKKYQDENLSMDKMMELKLLREYPKDLYTFKKLNAYGIKAIRGSRSVPKKLSLQLNKK